MDEFDSAKDRIKRVYANGWFTFTITITFKPHLSYHSLHPKTAHENFKQVFSSYTNKRGIRFYLCPELSTNGALHYHGFVMFKGGNYDKFEKTYKLFRNWLSRKFGRSFCQRVYSFHEPYKAENIKSMYHKHESYTSYDKIWKYIHKEQVVSKRFAFMSILCTV